MQVLDSRETPGLGDKIIFDEEFHAELRRADGRAGDRRGEEGREAATRNEVDCITGATISSEAVVSILNNSTRAAGCRSSTGWRRRRDATRGGRR